MEYTFVFQIKLNIFLKILTKKTKLKLKLHKIHCINYFCLSIFQSTHLFPRFLMPLTDIQAWYFIINIENQILSNMINFKQNIYHSLDGLITGCFFLIVLSVSESELFEPRLDLFKKLN